jgi:DNA polymerase-1
MRPFKGALLVFARLLKDEEGLPVTQTTLVNSKETLRELIDQMSGAKIGSVDIESWSPHAPVGRFKGGGLAWWDPDWKLCAINFSFKPGYSYVLPLWHERTPWKNPEKVVQIIKPYMEAIPQWVMHNGKYDSKCLWRVGINVTHTVDTMGMEYALDENNIKDLGFLSKVYLGAPDYKEMINKGNIFYEPLDLLAEYGGQDSDYTLRLKSVIRNRLQGDFLSKRLYDKLLHKADVTLAHVEYRGTPLDESKLRERAIECAQLAAKQEEKIYDLSGWEFNCNSPAQLADVLYNHLGFPVLERTKTHSPSTREGVLLRLKGLDDTGLMDEILAYRKWQGYVSRYFNPYPRLVDEDWRLHAHFKPFHTVTGRLSCEAPNLQQVPRNTFVRGIFGTRPGWVILEADYSQAEMRLAAHYSQDRQLLRIFNTGRDVHMEMAMSITGKAEHEVTSEERKMAKSVNFGYLYGMGWRKYIVYAAENYELDVSEAQAKKARRQFFQDYKQLQAWHARQRGKAEKDGMVMSAIGRKRRLHDAYSTNQAVKEEAMRQAINSPVQSLASDMMLMAMIQLEEILPEEEAHLISTVHDSILFEVREDKVDKWAPVIKDIMENLPLEKEFDCLLTVPIVVDLKVGQYWSEGAKAI